MSQHPHIFDAASLIQTRAKFIHEARSLAPGNERDQKRQIARSLKRLSDVQSQVLESTTPRVRIFSIIKQ
jgi:hypothetical protein